jgi:hypothetical protein
MRFDRHTVVLLVRPPDAPELPEEEAAAVQDAHLASQADLHRQGHLIAAGPLDGRSSRWTPRPPAGSTAPTRRCGRAGWRCRS